MAANKDFLFDPKRNPLFREDYRPSEYKIPETKLHIALDETNTVVRNRFKVTRNPEMKHAGGPLVLDGENLRLKSAEMIVNGKRHALDPQEYIVDEKHLIIKNPPAKSFELEIVTEINPKENTALSGIYMAGDNILASQCEAQGFRRITYFLDRPDNLATFDVTLEADKAKFPTLLSNGNGDPHVTKDLGNGRHSISWQDPWPKPSYLFAVVGGNLKVLEDTFTTVSGKVVPVRIFVEPGYEDKITWAMQSIKRAMKWDEERYGREYDLDCFHIVAVEKFNAGAMENKGLNIFNVSCLVGDPDTATDDELIYIEKVLGHEYFHNYTGDRVTLRDWFELTLKEGLTVLRDHQFTGDMHSQSINTINGAIGMRAGQFMEDASTRSHPIRPDRVEAFENIYTGTIYEKGANVLGMLHTMMGETVWRAAMDEYFERFDGQAVTCEDFVDVMEDVSGIDLTQFRRWYSQSGTPEISYTGEYNAATKTYKLTLTQNTPPTADQKDKLDLHIPVAVGLIGQSGKDVPLWEQGVLYEVAPTETTRVLNLTKRSQTFVFTHVSGPVVPSILRGFSAPVKITTQPSDDDLIFRMAHDSDGFNKFDATESLMIKTLHGLIRDYKNHTAMKISPDFIEAYRNNVLNATTGDLQFNALTLGMPAYNMIIQGLKEVDPDAVNEALRFMGKTMIAEFGDDFRRIYAETAAPAGEKYDVVPEQVGRRALHNLSLAYLCRTNDLPETFAVAQQQYLNATNMTERISALSTMTRFTAPAAVDIAARMLDDFYTRYKDNANLVDKWLSVSAAIPVGDPLQRVKNLMTHPAYDKTNPNNVRALIGGFIGGNPTVYHKKDGSGYQFLADVIIDLNAVNPKIAAGLSVRFTQFKMFDAERQQLMVDQMKRIMATPNLDSGIRELVGKALEMAVANDNTPAAAVKKTFGQAAKK